MLYGSSYQDLSHINEPWNIIVDEELEDDELSGKKLFLLALSLNLLQILLPTVPLYQLSEDSNGEAVVEDSVRMEA